MLRHAVARAAAEWLKAAEPGLERIQTWNAESNRYMIAVNEALGYTILGQPARWWRLEVPAALGERALAGSRGTGLGDLGWDQS